MAVVLFQWGLIVRKSEFLIYGTHRIWFIYVKIHSVAGNWFLQTNDENPLSFGQNGIQYENNENIFKRMFNVVVGYIIDKTS